MTTFDRYVLRVFIRVLAICFFSLTGLFIVIDLFGNLEEFISYAERQGSLFAVVAEYYGARILSFFDRTSALLALVAAIFTITWFQRTNELTAIMAAGISKARAIRILIFAAIFVAILGAVNREIGLPRVRDKLTRNAQDWLGENAKRLTAKRDHRTNVLLGGKETIAADREIVQPIFRLPGELAPLGRQLVATKATYYPASQDHPSGYLLSGVTQPDDIDQQPSCPQSEDSQPIVMTSQDCSWLQAGECFVVSDVTFDHLAADRAWQQYSSTPQLIRALRNPSLDYGADTRVAVHRRFVQPILDVTLLFLGLPLVLSRSHRNLFLAAGKCLLLVGLFFIVSLACQALGNTVVLSPAAAAWLPLLIFPPPAYMASIRRWE